MTLVAVGSWCYERATTFPAPEGHIVNFSADSIPGIIYMIHFDEPFRHAQHYLGWCNYDHLEQRLLEHRRNRGANLVKYVNNAGITWRLGRVWEGVDRNQERRWKCRGFTRTCWICTPPQRQTAASRELMNRWRGYEVPQTSSAHVADSDLDDGLRDGLQATG